MTVSTVETRKTYNGNGVTDAFATPYFLADSDLVVYVDNVLQTIATDYTVAGAGVPAGGTVTFVTPPPSGSGNVVIIVDPELTQLTDWVENDRNGAEVKEIAFDKLTIIAQRLADRMNRVVQLSDTDTSTVLTLPELADRLSKFLAFDASGDLVAADGGTVGVPVSTYMATLLDDADEAAALTTLGIGVSSPTITATDSDLTITSEQFAAYDTLNLDLSAWTVARNVIVPAIGRNFTPRHNAGTYTATVKTAAGTGIPVAAGTARPLVCDGVNVVDPLTDKDLPGIFSIGATVAANALTVTLSPCTVDFRSSTLNNGAVSRVRVPSTISLTISSGSTLGTVANVAARLAVIAINSSGAGELAIVNLAGGNNLSEGGVISTTAEGGAGGADSANVIYSTTARSNVAYRVVGFVDITEATPGTWATAPSLVQGAGGIVGAAMQSLGYGQRWQDVTAGRSYGVTYYNDTGRPIQIKSVGANSAASSSFNMELKVAGLTVDVADTISPGTIGYGKHGVSAIVPPGSSYSVIVSQVTKSAWLELR
jgi:hypothetical protein